ncbi:MAG: pyruvate kinase, partial [Planctomycetes bacterium]|nr:pyruvate kinase [Planctomycetota bacterium]
LISFADARGRLRRLRVVAVDRASVSAEAASGAYVEPGVHLRVRRGATMIHEEDLGALPALEEPLLLAVGDILLVTTGAVPGRPARRDDAGRVIAPASIPCTLPEVFREVLPGERIWFDDGKLGGVVRAATADVLTVAITAGRDGGVRLRSDKGINLPDSTLTLPCLSPQDRQDLGFARRHADLVGLSFVRHPGDVAELVGLLGAGPRRPGIILKIETPQAFAALPAILLAGLAAGPLGVMVARGDLAVEVGFARLAEVQEEILWLSEAAHLPVIWGTQVLETLAKKGIATRAEVTDAAMSVRAECVMLNKGPHIVAAVRFLADVLGRMRAHQAKKSTLLRRLAVSRQG